MGKQIPESHLDLFHKRAIGHLATLMPDGSPQVTPVWVDYDGTYLLINTAKGRLKDRNMRQRSQVALEVLDPDDIYRWISIGGRVVEVTSEGADDHIDKLYQRYLNIDTYPHRKASEERVIFKIEPEHFVVWFGEISIPHG